MFAFFRPEPQYSVGKLVVCAIPEKKEGYLLIGRRRWMCPNGHTNKRWVYDGILFCVDGEKLCISTFISCVSEKSLSSVPKTSV